MKIKSKLAFLAATTALSIPVSHAQTISNGGFEANGSLFTDYPGTTGAGSNPADITGWTAVSTSYGIGGLPPQSAPFLPLAPINQGTSAAFLQGVGTATSLSQTVTGLTTNSTYWVTYRENARSGNTDVSSSATLGASTIVADHAVASTGLFALRVSDSYTATGTSADLVLNNTSMVFDNTLVVDDVRLYYVTPNATPVGMNSSFETNNLTGIQYLQGSAPGGVPGALWGFTSGAGIAKNGSIFGNPDATNGTSVALIQNTGSFSDVYGTFETGKQYQLTLDVAARSGVGSEFRVTLGGQTILFDGNPTYTPDNVGSYITLTSETFTVAAAGPKELLFEGLSSGGDVTSFIDNIGITIISGQTPYEAWALGALFGDDANGDGVENGLAFLLGASSPSAAVTLPTFSQSGGDLTLIFSSRNDDNRGSATLNLQHSSDLGISDPWVSVPVTDASVALPINGVTLNVIQASPNNTVTATISSSEAAAGKLFGRLMALP